MMKAGTYYIGDLCYVMHPEWDEFCALTISGHNVLDGEFNLKDGRRFATFTTKWAMAPTRMSKAILTVLMLA